MLKAVIAHAVNKQPPDCPINPTLTKNNSLVNPTLPHSSSIVTDDAPISCNNTATSHSIGPERGSESTTQTSTRGSNKTHTTPSTSQNGLRSHARTPRLLTKMPSTDHHSTRKRGTVGRAVKGREPEGVASKTAGNKENSHSVETKRRELKMARVEEKRRDSATVQERQRKRERYQSTVDALHLSKRRKCSTTNAAGGEGVSRGPVRCPNDLRSRISSSKIINRQSGDSSSCLHPSTAVYVRDEKEDSVSNTRKRFDHVSSPCTVGDRSGGGDLGRNDWSRLLDVGVEKKESRRGKQPSANVDVPVDCEIGDCGDLEEGEIGNDCTEVPRATVSQNADVSSKENQETHSKSDVALIPINVTPVDAEPTQNDHSQHNMEQDHSMQCDTDHGESNIHQITSDNDTCIESETVLEGGYIWSLDDVKGPPSPVSGDMTHLQSMAVPSRPVGTLQSVQNEDHVAVPVQVKEVVSPSQNQLTPTADPSHPPVNPSHPTTDPSHPTADPSHPPVNPSHPTTDPSHPTVDPSHPTTNPTRPTQETMECPPFKPTPLPPPRHEAAPVPLPLELQDKKPSVMEGSKRSQTPPGVHVEFSSAPLLSPPECDPPLEISVEPQLRAPETQLKQLIAGGPMELPPPHQYPEVHIEVSSPVQSSEVLSPVQSNEVLSPVHVEEDTVTLFPDTELQCSVEGEREEGELSGNDEDDVTYSPPTPSSSPYKNGVNEVLESERRRDGTKSAGERGKEGDRGKRRGTDTRREQQSSTRSHLRLPELEPHLHNTYRRDSRERSRRRLHSPPRRRHRDYHPSPPPPLSNHTLHRLHRRRH